MGTDAGAGETCAEPMPVAKEPVIVDSQDLIRPGTFNIHKVNQSDRFGCWLNRAWRAYQAGELDPARRYYLNAHRVAPKDLDAMLGLAAVALRGRRIEAARNWYRRVLVLDPHNPTALTGMALLAKQPGSAAEAILQRQLKKEPQNARLYFALGNLYARQNRWPQAQNAYFNAFSRDPANPDYAYNLAVSLDRMGKFRLARRYYQKALQEAQLRPFAFSLEAVRERLQLLEAARG